MSTSIDLAFIKKFEAETHVAFQQKGSLMLGSVRRKTKIIGESTRFPIYGKGIAAEKTRHGDVPIMNNVHSNVEVFLTDKYAGEWVDNLDELKTNTDERGLATQASAWALGRAADIQIISAVEAGLPAGQKIANGAAGITLGKLLEAKRILLANEVPDDGNTYCWLDAHSWLEMLKIQQFASSDYSGKSIPLLKGSEARKFMNIHFMHHNGLTVTGNVAQCLMYHKSVIGHATGKEISQTWSWENTKSSHFLNSNMSMGAVRIDDLGVVQIDVDTSTAL